MLLFSLWPDGGGFDSIDQGLDALRGEAATRDEIGSVVDISFEAARHETADLTGPLADVPLKVHARYQREEILAALDYPRNPNSMREGVWYSREKNIDVLLITLKKSEADYSPTTMYRDYPISPTLFHWESQSTTSLASETGQRYVSGSSTVLLFAREEPKDEVGTSAYLFLGEGHHVSHEGERPIAITWELPTQCRQTSSLRPQSRPVDESTPSHRLARRGSNRGICAGLTSPGPRLFELQTSCSRWCCRSPRRRSRSRRGASWCRRSCRAGSRRRCR